MRAGQTEASVDLARLAGMIPAGVICEIMNDDGSMARVPDLIEFCREHELKMLTVAEVIRYRMEHERYVHRVGEALVDTRFGEFRMIAYESEMVRPGSAVVSTTVCTQRPTSHTTLSTSSHRVTEAGDQVSGTRPGGAGRRQVRRRIRHGSRRAQEQQHSDPPLPPRRTSRAAVPERGQGSGRHSLRTRARPSRRETPRSARDLLVAAVEEPEEPFGADHRRGHGSHRTESVTVRHGSTLSAPCGPASVTVSRSAGACQYMYRSTSSLTTLPVTGSGAASARCVTSSTGPAVRSPRVAPG